MGTISVLALQSTRGALVYSILYLSFLIVVTSGKRKRAVKRLVICGFALVLLYLTLGGLPTLSLMYDTSRITADFDVSSEKKGERSAIDEIEWRFGASSRMSATFIRMYDRGDGAGLNPILNSVRGFLPRSIDPDKPIPSTVDGSDIYTQGMYFIYREVYGYDTYSMTEFSSGGHAYWELGLLGVILLPLVSGVYIGLCAYHFQRLGIISLALMMAIFKPFGYVDPKIWVSDVALQLYQLILPLTLLWLIYRMSRFIGAILSRKPYWKTSTSSSL